MNEQELMLTKVLGCRRPDLYTDTPVLTEEQGLSFLDMQTRRKSGEPLQYILGDWDFCGMTFKVDTRALIPRPETEILVEKVLGCLRKKQESHLRILELGTGSGNIAVTIAKELTNARVVTSDVSKEALDLARENAALNNVVERIEFNFGDMNEFLLNPPKECVAAFDCLVSNPPYVPSEQILKLAPEIHFEPQLALDGGVDGLNFIRLIVQNGWRFINPGGCIAIEFGDGQEDVISYEIFETKKYQTIRFFSDDIGKKRIVLADLGE